MKKKIQFMLIPFAGIVLVGIFATGIFSTTESKAVNKSRAYDDLYVGAMHPWVASEGPGECDICGMALSQVNGHKHGTPLPNVDNLFVSPSDAMYVHEGPGEDPKTGEKLIPIKESPYYQPPSEEHSPEHRAESGEHLDSDKHSAEHKTQQSSDSKQLYTCGMHPDVIQDEPGNCPICGMNLTKIRGSGRRSSTGERQIAYWVAPMNPGFISDEPGKSPMGMDLVPVYEDELNEGTVLIDPVTLQSIGVSTEAAEYRDLSKTIRSNGVVTVAEDAEVKLNSKVSGWVEVLHVARTGDYVEKGQPMLEIYSPELVAAQEEYLIAIDNAALLGISNPSSGGQDLLQAAKRRLQLWDITDEQIDLLEQTREVTKTMTLVSPGNGIVLHKNIIEGAAIKPGMDLFRIADLSTIWVIAQVYEYELPWVKVGNRVEVFSPYDPNLKIKGSVDYIYPTLNPKTRTIDIRIVLANPRLRLKLDMYVDARITTASRKKVVSVQKSAIIRSGERDIVFVQKGQGRFEPVEVHLGVEAGGYYEIAHGLSAGEEVVTSAQFLLDSESNLQEAIQRRIEQRQLLGASSKKL